MLARDSQSAQIDRRRGLLFVLVVLVAGVANVVWRLGTPGDWWFEDDPVLYAAIGKVASPWLFFYDMAANRLATTGPNELAPVLLSSMWLDLWLAPRSTAWAYAHSGLVYLATAVAFYFAMLRLLREKWLALATTIAWMLLPSTSVLVEFLSTRHYMIGMFWALLAAMSVDDALEGPARTEGVSPAAGGGVHLAVDHLEGVFPAGRPDLDLPVVRLAAGLARRRHSGGAGRPVRDLSLLDDGAVARLLR